MEEELGVRRTPLAAHYDIGADIQARAERIAARQAKPEFEETEFDAYIIDCRVRMGGDVEFRMGIPRAQKWEGLKLSDAAGIMVHIHAARRYRDGEQRRGRFLDGETGDSGGFGDPDDLESPTEDDETLVYGSGRTDPSRYMRAPHARKQ